MTDATPSPGAPLAAPAWLRDVPLAHRGLHAEATPENSLPAFAAARDAGYGVELDVMLSADEVPVVVHDPALTRVAGIDERVSALTASQLASVQLDGTDAHVPTLAEALEILGDAPAMIEVKQARLRPGRLEEAIAQVLDTHRGPVCVASFNPVSVRWFRSNRPQVVRVMTATAQRDNGIPAIVARRLASLRDAPKVQPHAVSYDLGSLPHPVTDGWRAAGGLLVTWTAVGPDGLARGRELADNVIFEHVLP